MIKADYSFSAIISGFKIENKSLDQIVDIFKEAGKCNANLVAGLASSDFSANEITTSVNRYDLSSADIAKGFKASSVSTSDCMNALQTTFGLSDEDLAKKMISANFTYKGIVSSFKDQGKSLNQIVDIFKTAGKCNVNLVSGLFKSSFSADEITTSVNRYDLSSTDIAKGLKAGSVNVLDCMNALHATFGLSDEDLAKKMISANFTYKGIVSGFKSQNKSLDQIVDIFKTAGKCNVNLVSGLYRDGFSADEITTSVSRYNLSSTDIAKGLKASSGSASDCMNSFQRYDLSDKDLSKLMMKAKYTTEEIVHASLDLGNNTNDIISSVKEASGKLPDIMSAILTYNQ